MMSWLWRDSCSFTVRFKECCFPGGLGSLGFSVPHLNISPGCKGKLHMQMWTGWSPLAGRSLTSRRLRDRWEQNGRQLWCLWRREKKAARLDVCKTKWLWMEQLTGNIFHLQLHVEVISPNELKLLENCKSNGKWKGHYALQGLNSWTWIPAVLPALKGKLQSFSGSNNLQKNFWDAYSFCLPLLISLLESELVLLLLKFAFSFMVGENSSGKSSVYPIIMHVGAWFQQPRQK